ALATIAGMLPLAFAIGAGSQMLQPLAITVIGGLLSSMVLSLVFTPAIHYYLRPKQSQLAQPRPCQPIAQTDPPRLVPGLQLRPVFGLMPRLGCDPLGRAASGSQRNRPSPAVPSQMSAPVRSLKDSLSRSAAFAFASPRLPSAAPQLRFHPDSTSYR